MTPQFLADQIMGEFLMLNKKQKPSVKFHFSFLWHRKEEVQTEAFPLLYVCISLMADYKWFASQRVKNMSQEIKEQVHNYQRNNFFFFWYCIFVFGIFGILFIKSIKRQIAAKSWDSRECFLILTYEYRHSSIINEQTLISVCCWSPVTLTWMSGLEIRSTRSSIILVQSWQTSPSWVENHTSPIMNLN